MEITEKDTFWSTDLENLRPNNSLPIELKEFYYDETIPGQGNIGLKDLAMVEIPKYGLVERVILSFKAFFK